MVFVRPNEKFEVQVSLESPIAPTNDVFAHSFIGNDAARLVP